MIEDIFYRKYPQLRRLKLKSFRSLEQLASILHTDELTAFYRVVRGYDLHAVEWQTFILIHPDGVIKELYKQDKKMLKKIRID